MTSLSEIKAIFNTPEDKYLQDLCAEADKMVQEQMTESGKKPIHYQPSQIPAIDRLITLRHQQRQHKLTMARQKIQAQLEILDEQDIKLHKQKSEGVANAREKFIIHLSKKAKLRETKEKIYSLQQHQDNDFMDEGLSQAGYYRCLGWFFGNLEQLPHVTQKLNKKGKLRTDMASVTMEDIAELEQDLLKEMGLSDACEQSSDIGEEGFSVNEDGDDACPDHVVKVDTAMQVRGSTKNRDHFKGEKTQANQGTSPRIGDGLSTDQMDEMDEEFAKMDQAQAAHRKTNAKMTVRKASKNLNDSRVSVSEDIMKQGYPVCHVVHTASA